MTNISEPYITITTNNNGDDTIVVTVLEASIITASSQVIKNSSEHIFLVNYNITKLTISPLLDQYDTSAIPSEYASTSL